MTGLVLYSGLQLITTLFETVASTSGSTTKPADGTYKISNIALEFDVVKDKRLKNLMISQYNNLDIPYDRILRYRIIPLKKQDTTMEHSGKRIIGESQRVVAIVCGSRDEESLIASKMRNFITQKLQKSI